jgi:hypothetical protein
MENEKVSGLVFRIGLQNEYSEPMNWEECFKAAGQEYREDATDEEKTVAFKTCLLNEVAKYKAAAEEVGISVTDFKIGIGEVMTEESDFFNILVKNIVDILSREWILYLKTTDAMTAFEVDQAYLKMSESLSQFTG